MIPEMRDPGYRAKGKGNVGGGGGGVQEIARRDLKGLDGVTQNV